MATIVKVPYLKKEEEIAYHCIEAAPLTQLHEH